jgi:hypothetical protein
MKKWQKPELEMLKLEATEYRLFGNTCDGGYLGDGIISGHSKWKCPPPPCRPDCGNPS